LWCYGMLAMVTGRSWWPPLPVLVLFICDLMGDMGGCYIMLHTDIH
jgi:hypothetical protein